MSGRGMFPNTISYGTLINRLVKSGMMSSALKVFDEMIEKEVTPNVMYYNILTDGFFKKGDFLEANEVWERLVNSLSVYPDVGSYNVIYSISSLTLSISDFPVGTGVDDLWERVKVITIFLKLYVFKGNVARGVPPTVHPPRLCPATVPIALSPGQCRAGCTTYGTSAATVTMALSPGQSRAKGQ
ncbi:hypothetical protein L6452_18796 [Arctium lappa]|uniref:Uncharacterized protein n=1 Tax=Arctium lappa TaxID=4217 RepID=A0ACB9C795_ARCLA|nr:hypothetical protein L6452_18796 [Arctium lappa]